MDIFSQFEQLDKTSIAVPISFFKAIRPERNPDADWLSGQQPHTPESQEVTTWDKVIVAMARWSEWRFDQKSDAFLISPTIYEPARRGLANATVAALLIIDADHDLSFDIARDRLREGGVEAIIATTGSNIDGTKFRVIIPLIEPIPIEDQRRAVQACCRWLYRDDGTTPDKGKMNAVSLFYVPGTYARVQIKE